MSWLKDYFSFTRRERNAFIVILVLIGTFLFLPDLFRPRKLPLVVANIPGAAVNPARQSVYDSTEDENTGFPYADAPVKEIRMFTFDPNTLDEAGFIRLGLPEKTARTIIRYRDKGGRFRQPQDLRKIYTLRTADAERMIPYVRIATADTGKQYRDHGKSWNSREKPVVKPIDINTATEAEWKSLPGIGDVLAPRIVKFRERIGGFSSIEQVSKTYGLRDSVFLLIKPFLKLSAPAVNRVNINTAFENELAECPAIPPDVARAIVIYRKQHGRYQTTDDLKKIVFITDELFRKIAPFVKTD